MSAMVYLIMGLYIPDFKVKKILNYLEWIRLRIVSSITQSLLVLLWSNCVKV